MHMETLSSLNKAQLQILKLLSNIKTEEETKELSQVISNFYAKKATEEMDRLWESGQWNEEKNDQILKEHLRTPYKNGNA
jgi:ERCC4-type nuclease